MLTLLSRHLQTLPMMPELREAFERLIADDERMLPVNAHVVNTISTVAQSINSKAAGTETFAAAWCFFYTTAMRLDNWQDGDPLQSSWLATLSPAAQCHLIISSYTLSVSVLNTLVSAGVPEDRAHRLRCFWSESVLRLTSGQYRDLLAAGTHALSLPQYQEMAQAKTGAFFALAFGGAAILATTNEELIVACTFVGEMYGMLLQFWDDLLDAREQRDTTPAFADVFLAARPDLATIVQSPRLFWDYVYTHYYQRVVAALSTAPAHVQQSIATLFVETFGQPYAKS